jgi:hypothetical protein
MPKTLALLYVVIICFCSLTRISVAGTNEKNLDISSERSLKWSSYTQAGYTHGEQGKERFKVRQARVILKGDVLKNIDYKLQIDATKTPILLDAKIGVNLSPYAKLSFGQFKVPFSIENLVSGSELDTINRSNTVKKLCPGRDIGSQGRDIGVALSGKYSLVEYTLGIFNGSGKNRGDTNDQLDLAGRLVWTLFRSFSIGLSHYKGSYNPEPDLPIVKRNRTGVDIAFIGERSLLKGELIFARDNQVESSGWYVQAGYYLIKNTLEALVKHDFFDKNTSIGGDQSVVTTLGVNYFISGKSKFQINYEYRKGEFCFPSRGVILAQIQAGF